MTTTTTNHNDVDLSLRSTMASAESLGALVHRLSGVYRDPQRVLRDAEALLSSSLGAHLRPTTEPLTLNDGSSTPPVLLLRGTLPMTYRGVTYNTPVDLYLPPPYPMRPPTAFVRPVAGMAIKENHKHVGLDGRVYLPYLHEWRPSTHDLRELALFMSSLFGSEPPCYAKPAAAASVPPSAANGGGRCDHGRRRQSPPPYPGSAGAGGASSLPAAILSSLPAAIRPSNAAGAAEEERRKKLEREIADANLAAETARRAEAEEAKAEAEKVRRQRDRANELSSTKALATTMVRAEARTHHRDAREGLRTELKGRKRMEHGKGRIKESLKEGEERNGELVKMNRELGEEIEKLEKWLGAAKEQSAEEEEGETSEADDGRCRADLMAMPADVPSAQMLALSAENSAIDDCIYHLDRALVRGSITVEVFLKEVRKLSKRQFLAKAHLIKIAQGRAAGTGRGRPGGPNRLPSC
ncbi:hypothetical protein ACHAWF_017349 [Thalassiosira exigua]